jgi:SET domain-containing protein
MTNIEDINKFLSENYEKNKYSEVITTPDGKEIVFDIQKINLLKKILPFELSKVEVLKSNLHGNGVFAKTFIKKGELITFYPGDIVRYYPNGRKKLKNEKIWHSVYYSDRYDKIRERDNMWDDDYAINLDNYYSICSHSGFTNDSNYLGHIINDGAKHNSTEKSEKLYMKITQIKSNCIYYPMIDNFHLAIVSKRDIKKGEELYVSYGMLYWRSRNNR